MSATASAVVLPPLVFHKSPNFSSRHGADIHLLVYHESAGHYHGDIEWLCNPKADASATGVMREDGGELTQLVKMADKAWAQDQFFNPFAIGIEHSNLTPKGYATETQLRESARLYAWLSLHFDIPVRIARAPQWIGICRHLDLGALGGGHFQCGMEDPAFYRWMEMIHHERTRGGFRKDYMR